MNNLRLAVSFKIFNSNFIQQINVIEVDTRNTQISTYQRKTLKNILIIQ